MWDVYALTADPRTRLALRTGMAFPSGYRSSDWSFVGEVENLPLGALVDLAGSDFAEFTIVGESAGDGVMETV